MIARVLKSLDSFVILLRDLFWWVFLCSYGFPKFLLSLRCICSLVLPNMPNLPPEIITDILCRLPVKSLQRFRCVSRWWCHLIDSKDFARLHLIRSKLSNSNPSLILGFLGIYAVDLDSLDVACALNPPFSSSDVTNSCNGLVLVSMGHKQLPFLWNPFTRKYKTLPDVSVDYPPGTDSSSAYTRYGFGYDSQNDDYKVVRAVEFRGAEFNWISTEARIYSLRSNSWRKIPDFNYRIPRTRDWAVHVNDALHTIVYIHNLDPSILALDLRTEKTYLVPKPDMLVSTGDLKLHALGGSLCLLNPFKKHGTEIWIMKEYSVKESWTVLLSIAPPKIEPYTYLSPVVYSKSGDEVLLNLNEEKLVWYDLRKKTTREVTIRGLPFRFYANIIMGSLISPDIYDCGNEVKKPLPYRQDKRNGKIRRKR